MSTMDVIWVILLMLLLLFLKGFFSGAEIAFVSTDKLKLSHRARQGHRGARLVVELFQRYERLLTTTLVGTNASTVTLTALGTVMMIHFFGPERGDLYAFLMFTPLFLILGEIVPKSVYQQKADALVAIIVYPLRFFMWFFAPVVFLFAHVARLAARLLGGVATGRYLFITRDQLRTVIEMADRAEGATVFDRFRIERAIRFAKTTVGEEMTPVSEMVTIDSEKTTIDAMRLVRRRGHNALPVYEGASTNVVGIVTLSVWDMLDPALAEKPLADLIRPVHYVSPFDSLEELLLVLRERDEKLAIVVDEYGSTIGMITLRDIMEAVVGTIDVGYDFEEYAPRQMRKYDRLADGVYLMDARLPISEVNEVLGLNLPATEFHTLGGMVTARLRHLAKEGEWFVEQDCRFTVVEATERVVRSVRVER
jgi:CBS domain containing-hemolysin-like protein